MSFAPQVDASLIIEGEPHRFMAHPAARGMNIVWGQTGRFGTVYALESHGSRYALKVFAAGFRDEGFVENALQLRRYSIFPELRACARIVLTPENHGDLLQQYPDLTYAVRMPWIVGSTWLQAMQESANDGRPLTRQQSHSLANELARTLARMQSWGIAHCDLSNSNVMVTIEPPSIALVDVEDMYAGDFRRPEQLTVGSPGYAHFTAPAGLWSPIADRFAGAVLIAEMLGWSDPVIRHSACGEYYFDPREMPSERARSTTCERLNILLSVLADRWSPEIAQAFATAWYSKTLQECPAMSQWAQLIADCTPAPPSAPPPADTTKLKRKQEPIATPQQKDAEGGIPTFVWVIIVIVGLLILMRC
jgi:hypothetical protein